MKMTLIDSSKVKVENYGSIAVQELLSLQESESMSVAIITLDGTNEKNRNNGSNMYYFIIEGEGAFIIEEKTFRVKKHNLITIPKGTAYYDTGKMTMLSFCSPRFDASQIEYLK